MKPLSSSRARQSGLSIVEMVVAVTVVALFGSVMFNMLYSSMILFAKNSAIDVAHQEARVAVLQMEQDIHAAVSIPELTDASRNARSRSRLAPVPLPTKIRSRSVPVLRLSPGDPLITQVDILPRSGSG
jgi:type II secretory pathway component PulJ